MQKKRRGKQHATKGMKSFYGEHAATRQCVSFRCVTAGMLYSHRLINHHRLDLRQGVDWLCQSIQFTNSPEACSITRFPPFFCSTVRESSRIVCPLDFTYFICHSWCLHWKNCSLCQGLSVYNFPSFTECMVEMESTRRCSEAAVSHLNTLRQFQDNNRLCQPESSSGADSRSLSLWKNAMGFISVWSFFPRVKWICTF